MRLMDYVHQGGEIMYILLLLNILGISLLIWRGLVIIGIRRKTEPMVDEILASLKSLKGLTDPQIQMARLKDEVSHRVHSLEFGLSTIKIIATISPLLGLLGTVVGIFVAFQVISQEGMNNPSLFAGGISLALITTVGGLIVAIPHYIGHNYLINLLDDLELRLEKLCLEKFFSGGQS